VLKYVIEGGHAVRDLELAECDGHVIMTARIPGQEIGGKKLDEHSFMFAMGHKGSIKKVGAFAHRKDAFAAARCEDRP
jgi:hypothetical protein